MAYPTHHMRLFIGIPLPGFFIQALEEVETINKHIGKIRWTPPQNLHITLHFLGNTEEDRIDEVIRQLQSVAQRNEPFTLLFHEYRLAPKKKPYMIWATFLPNPAFVQLSKTIHAIISPVHKLKEPVAHITLARFKYLKNPSQIVLPSVVTPSEIAVKQMTLWASELKPEGPIYTPLHTFDLGR